MNQKNETRSFDIIALIQTNMHNLPQEWTTI